MNTKVIATGVSGILLLGTSAYFFFTGKKVPVVVATVTPIV